MFKQCTAQSTSSEKLSGKRPSLSSWILDTGASHHMTGSKGLLLDLKDISSSIIGLPNGYHTEASQEGTILLNGHVKIPHVLYVPQLTCNLISLGKLIEDLNCIVTLTDKLCVIQDRTLRTVIGAGEQHGGSIGFVQWL